MNHTAAANTQQIEYSLQQNGIVALGTEVFDHNVRSYEVSVGNYNKNTNYNLNGIRKPQQSVRRYFLLNYYLSIDNNSLTMF